MKEDHRSYRQLLQLRKESLCSALPIELTSQLGAGR